MFGKSMQHMIEETNARPDPDLLRWGVLAGVMLGLLVRNGREAFFRREQVQRAPIKRKGDLNLGFLGYTLHQHFAGGKGSHFEDFW